MPSWNSGKSAVLNWMRGYLDYTSEDCLKWPFVRAHGEDGPK